MEQFDENTPLFVISVAAELAVMHPQTLRQYDRMGLVTPSRTSGSSRRYTMRNVAQLREIARLSAEGVSLEGIRRILELENQNAELSKRVRDLEQALANELMNRPGPTAVAQQIKAIVHRPEAITPQVRTAIERNVGRPGGGRHFLALLRGLTSLRGQHARVWQRSHDILRQLPGLPVLFVHGEHDVVLPVDHSRRAHAVARGSELVVLDDCGHTPQLEKPELFNGLLQGLVSSSTIP